MDNNQLPGALFMRSIGTTIKEALPEGFGFALIVFPFLRPGISNYISTAERISMIQALKETIVRLESNSDFKTPEEN